MTQKIKTSNPNSVDFSVILYLNSILAFFGLGNPPPSLLYVGTPILFWETTIHDVPSFIGTMDESLDS